MSAVLVSAHREWSTVQWQDAVAQAAMLLRSQGTQVLATVLDNSPAFLALDEAALQLGLVHVPLPTFFMAEQMRHALAAVGADTLCVPPALTAAWPASEWTPVSVADVSLCLTRPLQVAQPATVHSGTVKVTFTSGTTGTPKGVCLSAQNLDSVVYGLMQAMAPLGIARHLSALPYAVLLENVAGVMAARRQGATVVSLPLADVGLMGSSEFHPERLDAAVRYHQPESLILLPQMLKAWCAYLQASGRTAPPSLRFVAVGGAPLGQSWLERARQLGMPAYEGYGLSEGASVQTLSLPWAHRDGTVGRVLPQREVRVASDGEIEVRGSLFLGYLGHPAHTGDWWPTGDLGQLDADGYLTIRGRKKHVLITGFGRNVSPEWVETALQQEPALSQVVVVGDGDARLGAVVWAPLAASNKAARQAGRAAIQAAIDRTNATLPDYARITRWVQADPALHSGFFTPNGRPLRTRMESFFCALHGQETASSLATS
jgi:long-chain acyl-CoA synthetase